MKIIYSRSISKAVPFLILMFVSFGCTMMETVESTQVPQAEIVQTYNVSASRERTFVTAYFNHGSWGKSVDLDAPSKIEHNGAELPQNSISFLSGTTYKTSSAGAETRHVFVYTNNDRQTFRNEFSFTPLEIETPEISVSRSRETVVRLSRAVGRDENVSIRLESTENPPVADNANGNQPNKTEARENDLSLDNELDDSRSAIVLKPQNLKKFVNGKAVLRITVSGSPALQQATAAGGGMSWDYTAAAQVVVVD